MSSLRVVVYGEGRGELGGDETRLPPPGQRLEEPMLGAAHLLLRRALVQARALEEDDVRFDAPLLVRGRVACGSDLLDAARLRGLLAWATPTRTPDLVVVLVDADGHGPARRKALRQVAGTCRVPCVVGVAVQEFEAWLVTDTKAIAQVVGVPAPPTLRSPERLAPFAARKRLADFLANHGSDAQRRLRSELARHCDLGVLKKGSSSFASLLRELRAEGAGG